MFVKSYCSKECFKKVINEFQQEAFNSFWRSVEYEMQNTMLSGMITRKNPKERPKNIEKAPVLWDYKFHCQTIDTNVYKKFLCNLFSIDKSRFKIVRNKLLNNAVMKDLHCQHGNQNVKLRDDLKDLIKLHYLSIPDESYYDHEDTMLQHFDNPELNLRK